MTETDPLRRDLARMEDENKFMREQLSLAMSGWRDEQQRTRDLEKRIQELLSSEAMQTSVPVAPGLPMTDKPVTDKSAPKSVKVKPAEWTWAWFVDWFQNK